MAYRIAQFMPALMFACTTVTHAQTAPAKAHWVAAWTASAHGPYPVGNPTAQPELKFAIPDGGQHKRAA